MVLYYAVGGGWGHLSRAKKILNALKIDRFKVISSPHPGAFDIFPPEQIIMLPATWAKTPYKVMDNIISTLKEEGAEKLYIDTFPNGILGELDISLLSRISECHYVARYVKWDAYEKKSHSEGSFKSTLIIDYLDPGQQSYIDQHSEEKRSLCLRETVSSHTAHTLQLSGTEENWLIAHSYPETEVTELFHYARDIATAEGRSPHYIISSAILPLTSPFEKTTFIQHYPIKDYFHQSDRIISACGFNMMLETAPFMDKHHFLPFPRKYDDQFLRARHRKQKLKKLQGP